MRKNAQKAPDSDERGANGKEQGKELKSAANQRKGGKVSVYCERFAELIPAYANTQAEFSELTGIPTDAVSRMKSQEGVLMARLPDIAESIPVFDFGYLFYGKRESWSPVRVKRYLQKAMELL